MLTQTRLKEVLHYDPLTGDFTWLARNLRPGFERTDASWNGRYAGTRAGQIYGDRARIRISIDNRRYLAHRLAWLWVTGAWPKGEIDHKDLNSLNNRWSNLREATHSQNGFNRHGRSQYAKGVTIHRPSGLFQARIYANQKRMNLGYFKTVEDAHAAYSMAAKEIHGEFARII